MKIAYHDCYAHPLPEGHRFPMEKYDLLPKQLLHEGIAESKDFFIPQPIDWSHAQGIHDESYWNKLQSLKLNRHEIRRTGFPLSQKLVTRECIIMGGTLMAAEYALDVGYSFNIAGGTHHAGPDFGEGFCLLNDHAIAANHLIQKGLKKVLIIDLDVHQGNGTALIFKGRNDVFTFSMHGAKNFPLRKEQSHLDIGLEDGTNDELYLDTLNHNLSNIVSSFKPEFILYQCGVDVLEEDKLGRISLTLQGCKLRDQLVYQKAYDAGIPIAAAMGGGYAKDIRTIVDAHANTFKVARDILG